MTKKKSHRKIILHVIAVFLALSGVEFIYADMSGNYIGVDAVYSSLGFKQQYGGNLFVKRTAGVKGFYGYRFNEAFGVEIGHEADPNKNKDTVVYAGEYAAGTVATNIRGPGWTDNWLFRSKFSQSYSYVAAFFSKFITNNDIVSILFGGSLARIKSEFTMNKSVPAGGRPVAKGLFVDVGSFVVLPDGSSIFSLTRVAQKTVFIPIVRIAGEHKFNDQFGLRITGAWHRTSLFKKEFMNEIRPMFNELRMKDTIKLGLGLTYNF